MALRIKKAGVNVEYLLMKEYCHGFCIFDSMTIGVPEFRNGTNFTLKCFKELFDL